MTVVSIAVEGPPGSGKTTHCQRVSERLGAAHFRLVLIPEMLASAYNCGEDNQFHDVQAVKKEELALALCASGFGVLMDRCRVSTVLMRLTQAASELTMASYRQIERQIFGNCSLSVVALVLLQADLAVCRQRRRPLLANESREDLHDTFFDRLHSNYNAFYSQAGLLYPDTQIEMIPT